MKKVFSFLSNSYTAIIFFLFYSPIFLMIAISFNQSKSAYQWTGFSFDKYIALFNNDTIMNAFRNTIFLGLAAAVVATILGTVACLGIIAMGKRLQGLTIGVTNIPLLNADIVTGISLMLFFATFVSRMNEATLFISHVTLILPYVVLNVYPKLKQFDDGIYHAALDLGASPVQAYLKIVLPEVFPSMLTGFLLALTISLDDFTITYFTKSQGFNTLSTMIYTNRVRGILPEYYSLAAIMFVTMLILVFSSQLISMRKVERNRSK